MAGSIGEEGSQHKCMYRRSHDNYAHDKVRYEGKERRKELDLFEINKHNTEYSVYISQSYAGRLPLRHSLCRYRGSRHRHKLCEKKNDTIDKT